MGSGGILGDVSDHDTRLTVADSVAFGRQAPRPRRRRGVVGAAAAIVLAGAIVTVGVVVRSGPQSPDPPGVIAPGAWAASLPPGGPPPVPYLAGTQVVLPDGSRVASGGATARVVGMTTAGLVVLVASLTPEGNPSSSRFVLVTGAGVVRELPVPTVAVGGALEAVVSPDGRFLAASHDILDMADLGTVGHLPRNARYLLSWTPAGILYAAPDGDYFLWSQGAGSRPLAAFPGSFASGTDIGIKHCSIVRLTRSGRTSPLSACIEGVRWVSPTGRWALTRDLRLVEVASGRSRTLTPAPVDPLPGAYVQVWWEGDRSLLVPIGTHLVRCVTATARCERAADTPGLRDGVLALP